MKVSILFLIIAFGTEDISSNNTTLKKLLVIFRHGYRTPDVFAFNVSDSCFDGKPENVAGNLTKLGESQMSFLGYYFRLKYNSFLENTGNKAQVIYSNYPRCKLSAQLVFNGTFSEYNHTLDNSTNFFMISDILDGLINTDMIYYNKWMNTFSKNVKFQDMINTLNKLNATKSNITGPVEVFDVMDQMICEQANNCKLPVWLSETIQNQLLDLDVAVYNSFMSCADAEQSIVRTNSDAMVSQIGNYLNPKSGTGNVYFYALHDMNIALILTRMSIFNGLPVPFGSSLNFELHNIDNKNIVRIFYGNTTDYSTFHQLKLPNCSLDCPYEDFVQQTTSSKYACV